MGNYCSFQDKKHNKNIDLSFQLNQFIDKGQGDIKRKTQLDALRWYGGSITVTVPREQVIGEEGWCKKLIIKNPQGIMRQRNCFELPELFHSDTLFPE